MCICVPAFATLLSMCANDSLAKSKLLLCATSHLDLKERLNTWSLTTILDSLFLFLSALPVYSVCFCVWFCFLLFFLPSLADNSETGAVMSVLEALAVSSWLPSSLYWCLSGSDHRTQVFHIMPVPSPLPSFSYYLASKRKECNTGRMIKIPNLYLSKEHALDNNKTTKHYNLHKRLTFCISPS